MLNHYVVQLTPIYCCVSIMPQKKAPQVFKKIRLQVFLVESSRLIKFKIFQGFIIVIL